MADAVSILASAYKNVPAYQTGTYKAVDAKLWTGAWEGEHTNGDKFELAIQNVNGFRATVRFQIGKQVHNEAVLIKDNSFKISGSKFTLAANGAAEIKTVYNRADGTQTVLAAKGKRVT